MESLTPSPEIRKTIQSDIRKLAILERVGLCLLAVGLIGRLLASGNIVQFSTQLKSVLYFVDNNFLYFAFAGFAVLLLPPKRFRESPAKLLALDYRETGDSAAIDALVENSRYEKRNRYSFWANYTGQYWVPLYEELRRYGVEFPASLESKFRQIDKNPFNLLWAPIRRERSQRGMPIELSRNDTGVKPARPVQTSPISGKLDLPGESDPSSK